MTDNERSLLVAFSLAIVVAPLLSLSCSGGGGSGPGGGAGIPTSPPPRTACFDPGEYCVAFAGVSPACGSHAGSSAVVSYFSSGPETYGVTAWPIKADGTMVQSSSGLKIHEPGLAEGFGTGGGIEMRLESGGPVRTTQIEIRIQKPPLNGVFIQALDRVDCVLTWD